MSTFKLKKVLLFAHSRVLSRKGELLRTSKPILEEQRNKDARTTVKLEW
jgi:hypothetical protein